MRRRRIFPRPTRSIVQQTPTLSTREAFIRFNSGEVLEFPNSLGAESFDCESSDNVDWDSPRIEQAPNKIEQYLNPKKYGYVQDTIEEKPPVETPIPPADLPVPPADPTL